MVLVLYKFSMIHDARLCVSLAALEYKLDRTAKSRRCTSVQIFYCTV